MRMPDATHVQNHAIAGSGARLIAVRRRPRATRLRARFLSGCLQWKWHVVEKRRPRRRPSGPKSWNAAGRPAKSGSDELQYEFGYRHLRTKYDRIARILGMAEEIRFRRKPESRRLDFPPQRRLFNAMQGFRDAYACARLRRMVGDHQHTARFERLEQAAIHPCAVDIHERRVVIGKKEGDQIEIAHAGRDWIVIGSQHAYDVSHRRGFRALVKAFRRSRRNRLGVLRIDRSVGTDRAGEQLGRIASARSHIEHSHARPHAGEREQQLRISSLIGLTVGLGSVRARHDGAVVDVFALTHAGASRERRGAGKNDRPDKQFSVHVYCGGLTPSLLTATRPVVILPSAAALTSANAPAIDTNATLFMIVLPP